MDRREMLQTSWRSLGKTLATALGYGAGLRAALGRLGAESGRPRPASFPAREEEHRPPAAERDGETGGQ